MLPIFVISLLEDLERRASISKIMKKLSVDFEFIDAVKGKNLSQEELSQINLNFVESRERRKLALGEIGCTLSHLKAYKLMKERNLEWCCILEDDVILDNRFGMFMSTLKQDDLVGLEDDILFLGGQNGTKASKYISCSFWGKKNIGHELFYKTIKSEKYLYRTCCYLINIKVGGELINMASNDFFLADEWRYFKNNGIVKEFYLADFVNHPIDLVHSHIEKERAASYSISKNAASSGLIDSIKIYVNRNAFLYWLKNLSVLCRTHIRRIYP